MTGTLPVRAMTPDELRELMTANGIENANQLAAKMGLRQATVWRWLAGQRKIDRYAEALIRDFLTKKPKK